MLIWSHSVCDVAMRGDKDVVLILAKNLSMANLRSNMGKAGREKFEKEFTVEVFEKRMTWILEHLVYPLFSKKVCNFLCV